MTRSGDHRASTVRGSVSERLISGTRALGARAEGAIAHSTWLGGPTTATNGETINVQVAESIPDPTGTQKRWADFFAGLVHGNELGLLTVYVVAGADVGNRCGGDSRVLGCYGGQQMIIPNDAVAGVAPEEVARHEYGHHVAFNRLNPPWRAVDWGPKRWASQARVCSSTKLGALFPGDESDHYTLNPGEVWAETYRALNDQNAGIPLNWNVVSSQLIPDQAALTATEQDVTTPWLTPTVHVERRSFRRGQTRWKLVVQTPLDGEVRVTLTLPRGRNFHLTVLGADGKTVLAPGLWTAQTAQMATLTLCGERSIVVAVTGDGRAGRFTVVTTTP